MSEKRQSFLHLNSSHLIPNPHRLCLYGAFFLCTIVHIQTCSPAYQLDSAQSSLRTSFSNHNYEKSAALLDNYAQKNIYKSKDKVLLNLEKGMVNHFGSKYDSSNVFFTTAENEMDQLFTKSISRGLSSMLANDNTLAYNGEDYEDIYVNIFKSLNYIHKGNLDEALVESRRISYKLSQLDIKYNGVAEALSKADSTGIGNWKAGKNNMQNSAFGHYLSAVLYAKTDHPDDARIAYQNLTAAYQEQPLIYKFDEPDPNQLQNITDPRKYNLLVTGFSGRAPLKRQQDVRWFMDGPGLYLKFSFPSLHLYPTQVSYLELLVDDSTYKSVPLIEELDVVAQEVYKVKEPIIYARSLLRASLKAGGSRIISEAAEKKSSFLGGLTQLLGIFGQELSEKADLRSWQTMPGKAYATVLKLPPGVHQLTVNYYSKNRNIIFSDSQTMTITAGDNLKLIESLYWN